PPTTRELMPPPASKPATQESRPESRPHNELPASTYDSKPPYPVRIHVRSPDQDQPGWVRVVQLEDRDVPASLTGSFPEQNLMVVDTQNVQRVEIHVG